METGSPLSYLSQTTLQALALTTDEVIESIEHLMRPFQTGGNIALLVSGIISGSCLSPPRSARHGTLASRL